jgi:hypothetical protein
MRSSHAILAFLDRLVEAWSRQGSGASEREGVHGTHKDVQGLRDKGAHRAAPSAS